MVTGSLSLRFASTISEVLVQGWGDKCLRGPQAPCVTGGKTKRIRTEFRVALCYSLRIHTEPKSLADGFRKIRRLASPEVISARGTIADVP